MSGSIVETISYSNTHQCEILMSPDQFKQTVHPKRACCTCLQKPPLDAWSWLPWALKKIRKERSCVFTPPLLLICTNVNTRQIKPRRQDCHGDCRTGWGSGEAKVWITWMVAWKALFGKWQNRISRTGINSGQFSSSTVSTGISWLSERFEKCTYLFMCA